MKKIIIIFLNFYSSKNFFKILFAVFAAIGFASSFLLKETLATAVYQTGIETIGLFIPPFLTVVFFSIAGFQKKFSNSLYFFSVLLFVIQLIPFGEVLVYIVKPYPRDDFESYIKYAKNMIANSTLWGGDNLHLIDQGRSYVTQPGVRYFYALELLLFKQLYRFLSVLNIFLYISCIFLFMKLIKDAITSKLIQAFIYLLLILSVPYAVKNTLMGMPEWFGLILLMLSLFFFFSKKKIIPAIIILALIPFVRQNLLPPVLFLFVLYIFQQKQKIIPSIVFIAVLLLPVYHNLYYAGEFRFFSSIFKWPFLKYPDNESRIPVGFFPERIFNNLFHYLGFDWLRFKQPDFIEESFLLLWCFCILFFLSGKCFTNRFLKLIYYTSSVGLLIAPQLLMGTDYYPRFEFVNIYFIITIFIFLYDIQQKNPGVGVWEFIGLKNKLKQSV